MKLKLFTTYIFFDGVVTKKHWEEVSEINRNLPLS
jgi:hypothetical protein